MKDRESYANSKDSLVLAFEIQVIVDPVAVAESVLRVSRSLTETIVRNEIVSNLESVGYVRWVHVERKER